MKHQFKQVGAIEDNKKSFDIQDTVPLAALHEGMPVVINNAEVNLLAVARRVISEGLARLRDPQPEGFFTQGLQAVQSGTSVLGLLPVLTLTSTLGLLIVSFSYYLSQFGNLVLESSFFLGLLLIFVPNMLRLLSAAPWRFERICLLCVVGICFYLVLLMQSPLRFSNYDEFLHWRDAATIASSGHLFGDNSLLPVGPYYPGLEIVSNALSTITGMSTFQTGIVIISAARLLMILSLFMIYEQITRSSRMAGIATLIYITNPHFLIFDAIFSYETLALPLAVCMLYILARFESTGKNYRRVILTAYIVLVAVTITHHMTDYFFDGLLIVWAAVSLLRASSLNTRIILATIALFGVSISLAYAFLLRGNPVMSYLSQYFGTTFIEVGHILSGTSAARKLFVSGASKAPLWDELLMIASVSLISFGLPFGLLALWQQHRHNFLAFTFGVISIAYPVSQMFRFTNFGPEISDRSAAFLFLPIAYVLTIFITHFWPTRKLHWKATSLISCALSVVLLGGVLIESGPDWSSLPGPYLVTAGVRSIEPEGIQTASWAFSYLGPDNRVGTDEVNQILMLTYGDQTIVNYDNGINISTVFFSTQVSPQQVAMLRQAGIRYLVVDLRLSTSVPFIGYYFEDDEPGAFQYTHPISRQALTKFNTVPQISRIYDSGDIVIYDLGTPVNRSAP